VPPSGLAGPPLDPHDASQATPTTITPDITVVFLAVFLPAATRRFLSSMLAALTDMGSPWCAGHGLARQIA
jgi:hypothetical protein